MVKIFYRDLSPTIRIAAKAEAIRPWVFEFSQFLVDVMKVNTSARASSAPSPTIRDAICCASWACAKSRGAAVGG